MKAILEKKNELIDSLTPFEDYHDRFSYIIDIAKSIPELDPQYKIDSFLVEGCISQLWIVPSFKNGKCYFKVDSDAVITKGIASILTELYSNDTPNDILNLEPNFLEEVGITEHLSYNRRNGLSGVWNKIKSYAELCNQNK